MTSQELADRVRRGLNIGPVPATSKEREHLDDAYNSLRIMADRLQIAEEALQHYADEDNWEDQTPGPEVNTAGYPVYVYAGDYPWVVARRALEEAAE